MNSRLVRFRMMPACLHGGCHCGESTAGRNPARSVLQQRADSPYKAQKEQSRSSPKPAVTANQSRMAMVELLDLPRVCRRQEVLGWAINLNRLWCFGPDSWFRKVGRQERCPNWLKLQHPNATCRSRYHERCTRIQIHHILRQAGRPGAPQRRMDLPV